MRLIIWNLMTEESGQDLIEYALLAGFISLVSVLAVTAVGEAVNLEYEAIEGALPLGAGAAPPAG